MLYGMMTNKNQTKTGRVVKMSVMEQDHSHGHPRDDNGQCALGPSSRLLVPHVSEWPQPCIANRWAYSGRNLGSKAKWQPDKSEQIIQTILSYVIGFNQTSQTFKLESNLSLSLPGFLIN